MFIFNSFVRFNCVKEKNIILYSTYPLFIKTEAKSASPNEAFTTPVFVRGVGYYYCPGKKSPRS